MGWPYQQVSNKKRVPVQNSKGHFNMSFLFFGVMKPNNLRSDLLVQSEEVRFTTVRRHLLNSKVRNADSEFNLLYILEN